MQRPMNTALPTTERRRIGRVSSTEIAANGDATMLTERE
jgi:hypothetical protein